MRQFRSLPATAAFAALFVALLTLVWTPTASATGPARAFPDVIPLPNGFQPEGIVVGRGPVAYAGSLANGAIVRADLVSGQVETIVDAGPGPAVGLSFDRRSGYLYVSGGPNGDGRVYDTASGELVAAYDFGGAFVNDAIVTRRAVYFTDSFAPTLYKVALNGRGEPAAAFETLTLGGEFTFVPGEFNANGIEATFGGKWLIVVNTNLGTLYRVDPDSGEATLIDLGDADAANGDGLVLQGRTLYVVQNFQNQVAKFRLSSDYSSATLVDTLTSSAYDIPTTADIFGPRLYAVNARFGTPPGPDVTYDIVSVRR